MDAPIHFQLKAIDGKPMMSIDQAPTAGGAVEAPPATVFV
jgi:hypothetical protein